MGLLVTLLLAFTLNANAENQIRIIHTNDISGTLTDPGTGVGLASKITAVRNLQEDKPNLIVDAGNSLGPDILSAWEGGSSVVGAFRDAGYTAITLGHYDFDYGIDTLTVRNKESGIPFLAANVKGARPQDKLPFEPYLISKVGEVRVGLIGALDERIAFRMNPESAADIEVTSLVKSVKATLSALSSYAVDLTILLVHADQSTSIDIARSLPGLDLLIAGGHRLEAPGTATTYYQLSNGVHVLTTPPGSAVVGYADLTFTEDGETLKLADVRSRSQATDDMVPDSSIVNRAANVQVDYDSDSGKLLGKIDGITIGRRASAVGNLMRLHTESEIGVLSRKTFQEVEVADGFYQRDVNRLIRFDDVLVKMEVTGRQLKSIASRSKRLKESDDALVFTGLDVKNNIVNGRPVQNKERYRIVTLRRLSQGESGYKELSSGLSVQNTSISLRSLTSAGLEAWGTLSSASFWELNLKPVWRSAWALEGSFNRNYIDQTTESYRSQGERVSFLRGETSFAWKATSRYQVGRESSRSATTFESLADFGRAAGETTSDQFDVALTHRRRTQNLKVDPFVSAGFGTAFTRSGGGRPYQARTSAGFQRRFLKRWVAQFAARGQRDFAEKQSDYGAEVTLNYQIRLRQGGRFRSRIKSFFGFSERKVISVENYNTLNFPLLGELSLAVRQNNFLYRLDKIKGVPVTGIAFRSDLTVGLTYGIDWKWL